jgi:hypothetical protein
LAIDIELLGGRGGEGTECDPPPELKPGMEFSYVFDLGDNWRDRCRVQEAKVDPVEDLWCGPVGPGPGMGMGIDPGSVRSSLSGPPRWGRGITGLG